MSLSPRAAFVLVASVMTITAPAMAQTMPSAQSRSLAPPSGAAATLPNTFDAPVVPVAPPAATPVPAESAVAAAVLRVVIDQLRTGELNPTLYTTDLVTRLRGQLPTIRPLLAGYGAIQSVEAQGTRDGAGQFLVVFDEAATQWLIGLNEQGLIAALLFRPAPPESSDTEANAPAT